MAAERKFRDLLMRGEDADQMIRIGQDIALGGRRGLARRPGKLRGHQRGRPVRYQTASGRRHPGRVRRLIERVFAGSRKWA
jgi:hypothetical protein